jgi:hypothetical protein
MQTLSSGVCKRAAAFFLTLGGIAYVNAASVPQAVLDQEAALKQWLGHFRGMTRQQVAQEIGPPAMEDTVMATGEPRLHLLYHTPAGSDLTFSFFADGTVAVAAYSLVLH